MQVGVCTLVEGFLTKNVDKSKPSECFLQRDYLNIYFLFVMIISSLHKHNQSYLGARSYFYRQCYFFDLTCKRVEATADIWKQL